jgi:hypothetical protein
MTTHFKTFTELQAAKTESQILTIVNDFLYERAKRDEYHKAYNQRKAEMLKTLRANPELMKQVQQLQK